MGRSGRSADSTRSSCRSSSGAMCGADISSTVPMPAAAAADRASTCSSRRNADADGVASGGPRGVVGVALDPAVVRPAGQVAQLGCRRQGGRDDGRVDIDAGQVDDPAVRRAVQLVPGGRPALGPAPLVPAVAEDRPAGAGLGRLGQPVERVGQRRRCRSGPPRAGRDRSRWCGCGRRRTPGSRGRRRARPARQRTPAGPRRRPPKRGRSSAPRRPRRAAHPPARLRPRRSGLARRATGSGS